MVMADYPLQQRTIGRVLADKARRIPDKPFLLWQQQVFSYADLERITNRYANGFAALGIGHGDTVAVMLPNSPEFLWVVWGLAKLGAVGVPLNTAARGDMLQYFLSQSEARMLVIDSEWTDRLQAVASSLPSIQTYAFSGALPDAAFAALVPHARILPLPALPSDNDTAPPIDRVSPDDAHLIVYTSGTTGPSKGVLSSYLHIYTMAGPETWPFVTAEDRFMVNMPLFHVGGMGVLYTMFVRGGSVSVIERFDTVSFLQTVRDTGTTAVFLLGVMAAFLEKLPPQPDDADSPLRLAFMVPLAGDIAAFSQRFGCTIYTIFNMTEVSTPIISGPNPLVRGTCGQMRDGVEVRLVDENDCEVPLGTVGEMIIRTDRPWAMNSGYFRNPEATARAWRNGWFHTGDAFRKDEAGFYFFVDRMKDAIRRRGENISSFEVEAEVMAHPAVREAAAIGVPNELSEEDVLVVIAPVEGASVDPAELLAFLRPRMAHFMLPRYVRLLPELPKTPTSKVLKHELRQQGITADTWDRERAGVQVKADRLSTTASRQGA